MGFNNFEDKQTNSLEIEAFRKNLMSFFNENRIYFNKVAQKEKQIESTQGFGALKKLRKQFEEHLATIDKSEYEAAESLRQKMFKLISEQNIHVDKEFLQQIATQTRRSELKHLLYKLKEKYHLNLEDLENTVNSIKTIPGGLYGQGKNRKH